MTATLILARGPRTALNVIETNNDEVTDEEKKYRAKLVLDSIATRGAEIALAFKHGTPYRAVINELDTLQAWISEAKELIDDLATPLTIKMERRKKEEHEL